MRTNFDINIPSVPSKIIKFKIQDIKSTAFGSQRNRFNQNKGFLTKKFIESFNNFRQKQTKELDTNQTQAESQVSFHPQKTQLEYRFLIPEQKKYMLHHFQKYKNYQAPLLKQTKYNRGYSFYKTDNLSLNKSKQQQKELNSSIDNNNLTDNFYFPNKREKSRQAIGSLKKYGPTCNFKNQTRKRVYSKLQKTVNQIPGPGTYQIAPPKPQKKAKGKERQLQSEFDYKNLKKIITNIVASEQPVEIKEEIEQGEQARMNYMFMEDDRDRFGNQKYPIAYKLNVPGPGTYDVKDSLQSNAKKVILVEEQRKLLKEWFNN